MEIELTTSYADAYRSGVAGDRITVDDKDARRMIGAGRAKKPETATKGAPENAAKRTKPPTPRGGKQT